MKKIINNMLNWFEDRFNLLIDMIALIGGAFMILLSIAVFVLLIIDANPILDILGIIILPGAIGFFGIIILFALRITRHLTK